MRPKILTKKSKYSEDPYQFLNLSSPQALLTQRQNLQMKRSKKQLIWSGLAIAGLLIGLIAIASYKFGFGSSDRSYAYFEIKAIDDAGRPVAGALVLRENEDVGVTDSFGEWRRYLEVELGETVDLLFKKPGTKQRIARKSLQVPDSRPLKGDIEIYSSVQLKSSKAVAETAKTTKQKIANKKSNPETVYSNKNLSVRLQNADQEIASNRYYQISKNQITSYLNKSLRKQRSSNRVNCESLKMIYIPHKTTRGYLELNCMKADSVAWSLLRNIESSKKITASKIFTALNQTEQIFAKERSPVAGWLPLKLVFTGDLPEGARIYVSGYPVTYSKEGFWRYFGRPGGRANLTIIYKNEIMFRQQLSNNSHGARYINLPHQSIAQRSR